MSKLGYSHDSIENDYEEVADTALRRKLDVRPTWYVEGEHASLDTGSCPSWCYHAADSTATHEVEADHPMSVTHAIDVYPETIASLYPGERHHDTDNPWVTHTATLRSSLRQLGQGDPEIRIYLHHAGGPLPNERLRLTVADARDLIKVLTYLADLAETGAR